MFLLCDKLITQAVKNAKHWPKTCNETMSHGKMRVIVSRISPPLTSTLLNFKLPLIVGIHLYCWVERHPIRSKSLSKNATWSQTRYDFSYYQLQCIQDIGNLSDVLSKTYKTWHLFSNRNRWIKCWKNLRIAKFPRRTRGKAQWRWS